MTSPPEGLAADLRRTEGPHAAGPFGRDRQRLASAEDLGRHNAVGKVIGARFRARSLPDARAILHVRGRVSFEIVQKAAAAWVPIFSTVLAPSSLAVGSADRLVITLGAIAREDRMNLYTHFERVIGLG